MAQIEETFAQAQARRIAEQERRVAALAAGDEELVREQWMLQTLRSMSDAPSVFGRILPRGVARLSGA